MSDFINTIDVLGDDAVIDSIVDRSITEFKDDKVTKVGDYAFFRCGALEMVDLPNVTSLGSYVFAGTGLTELRLPSLSSVPPNSLRGCHKAVLVDLPICTTLNDYSLAEPYALSALVLRSDTVCVNKGKVLYNPSTIANPDPINTGTGYIYVPSALIEDYKVATNWSTYADQFRALEDYTVDGTTTGELDESKI